VQCAFEILTDCVQQETKRIASALKNPALALQRVLYENNNFYGKELKPLIRSNEWDEHSLENCQYWQNKLQTIIDKTNELVINSRNRKFQ
jgi:hypothetical protein